MSKSIAYCIHDMRRGDIYVDQEGGVVIRDSEDTDRLHHVGPFGDHWLLSPSFSWPAVRVFKQDRQDCEDPREFNRKSGKK